MKAEKLILSDEFIEKMKIQIVKRSQRGDSSDEIMCEMRDSFAGLFIDRGMARNKTEALRAGKNLTLKIFEQIKNKG